MKLSRLNHVGLIAMFALSVAGCSEKFSDEDLICDPSPGFIANPMGADKKTSFDAEGEVSQCIHNWGYRLGRAPGSNSEIAKATIGKCRIGINKLLEIRVSEGVLSKKPLMADFWQGSLQRFEEDALTRVVQGRAGNCSIRGVDQK